MRLTPQGLARIEGVADDYVAPGFRELLGVRGRDGMYRFHGGHRHIAIGHHLFTGGDGAAEAWQAWADRVFSAAGARGD